MNKNNQQISGRTNDPNGAFDTRTLGKRNFLRPAWILSLGLSVAGWAVLALFFNKTSSIDRDGFLHEPLFGLIPISYFFLFLGVVLALLDVARKLRKRR